MRSLLLWLALDLVARCAGVPTRTVDVGRGTIAMRVHDAGAPIVARLRIEGMNGTPDPELGPRHEADGAQTTVLTDHAGRARVELPGGDYQVIVTHGPLHAIASKRVRVRPGTQDLVVNLEREVETSWIGCDLHVHTTTSNDSAVTYADRVRSLLAENVRFVVPTDHNHITDLGPATKDLPIDTVPGVEVTTWGPAFGHFNAFPMERDEALPRGGAPSYQGWTPRRLFDALHERGAMVQVNHPRLDGGIGFFEHHDPLDRNVRFDLLEVWNGYQVGDSEALDRGFHEWLRMIDAGVRVVAVGNSDSHQVSGQWAGYPRTWVPSGEVLDQLRAGRAVVSTGPVLTASIRGAGPGSRVSRGRHSVRVEASGPSWMKLDRVEVYVGRTQVAEATVEGSRFTGSFDVDADAPIVVALRGERPMRQLFPGRRVEPRAFTNPIWVE